ncbi:hypothetical protein TWF694_007289 [Orbilia ellipsospora]|uniref:25S rRNA (uridine-N(3))-methyltransferase BMT5-like domain-containing protein n=1 Tax=Orbilia ellipsospora TaxID=2528407 RepID=A0AAV9XHA1_9PEZI
MKLSPFATRVVGVVILPTQISSSQHHHLTPPSPRSTTSARPNRSLKRIQNQNKHAMKHKKPDKRRSKPSAPLKPHHRSKITKSQSKPKPKSKQIHTQNTKPIIPFTPTSSLLLIGEGDFSFTNSLINTPHISPTAILTTTTNESEPSTLQKYPHSEPTITTLKSSHHKLLFNIDVTKKYPKAITSKRYDGIIFNFPHIGGLSTHLDRQIRGNQELLLSFFKNSVPLLSDTGSIIVTLFEGLPYSQWNTRELAKSCGLACSRSFKFDGSVYVGYKHMRTIGARDRDGDWKGEERGARSFIFEVADKKRKPKNDTKQLKKGRDSKDVKGRKDEVSTDEDDNDDEEDEE